MENLYSDLMSLGEINCSFLKGNVTQTLSFKIKFLHYIFNKTSILYNLLRNDHSGVFDPNTDSESKNISVFLKTLRQRRAF